MYIASRRVESAVGWCSRARIFYVRTCTFLVSRNRLDSDFFRDRRYNDSSSADVRRAFAFFIRGVRNANALASQSQWSLVTGHWLLATGQSPSPKPKAKAIRYDATADATLSTRSSFRCYVRPPPVAVVRSASASASTRRVASRRSVWSWSTR
ncbi:hypothetical protein V9T40_011745 [Parthenolecanium corni]|uniref:Uncharacterized protein n=1 Tax=Parthenolecanium corni TaxID=536013 RepID=A0AAN9T9G8_9HEMI